MLIEINAISYIITFLETRDNRSLNEFLNLLIYPNDDTKKDFSVLISKIQSLAIKDVKSISALIEVHKKSLVSNSKEYGYEKGDKYSSEQEDDDKIKSEYNALALETMIEKIETVSFLTKTEKNILNGFYDVNLLDDFSKALPKKMYFHILKTAHHKFYLFQDSMQE